MTTPKATAYWDVRLDVECPNCQHEFDVLKEDDRFLENHDVAGGDADVICPECLHQFPIEMRF